jgi:hypothetical protein
MKIKFHDDPWYHYEVSEFLTQDEFDAVKAYHIENVPPLEKGRNNLRNQFISEEMRGIITPRMHELAKLIKPKEDNTNRRLNIEMDTIQPEWAFSIHQDIKGKYIVFVLDLSDTGNGTRLHKSEDGPIVKTMPWIVNGGGGFIRTDYSWHSFDTHGATEPRRTVILNLM